jgi:hypothetical protein
MHCTAETWHFSAQDMAADRWNSDSMKKKKKDWQGLSDGSACTA